jgi:deazaflavin-dependent oxidoreductase (nitroreductase family)
MSDTQPGRQPGRQPARQPGRGQAALNVLMRTILRTPVLHRLVSGRILVIDIVGRKTGRRYRLPVAYVAADNALLVGTSGRWRRNLEPGQAVRVTVGRRRRDMTAEVITDERRCGEFYRSILAHNPVHGRYAGIRHAADGTPDMQDLRQALSRGLAVVRLQPAV